MSQALAFLIGFMIFSIDLAAIVWIVRLGLNVAAGQGWSPAKGITFGFLLIIKVVLVVLALAYAIVGLQCPAIPLFLGALTSLLIFSFYLLTRKLKATY